MCECLAEALIIWLSCRWACKDALGIPNFTVARLFEHKNALLLVCSNNLNRHLLVTRSFVGPLSPLPLSYTHQHTHTDSQVQSSSGLFVSLKRTCRISWILCGARHADLKERITAIASLFLCHLPRAPFQLLFFNICLKQAFLHLIRCSVAFWFFVFAVQQQLLRIAHMCVRLLSASLAQCWTWNCRKRFSFVEGHFLFSMFMHFFSPSLALWCCLFEHLSIRVCFFLLFRFIFNTFSVSGHMARHGEIESRLNKTISSSSRTGSGCVKSPPLILDDTQVTFEKNKSSAVVWASFFPLLLLPFRVHFVFFFPKLWSISFNSMQSTDDAKWTWK